MTDTGYTLDTPAQISATDRLGFTLFMAVALHAVVILGSSFIDESAPVPVQSLEITLAQYESKNAPEKADFLAQSNQEGSGTSEERRLLSTTEQSVFQDQKIRNQSAQPTLDSADPVPIPPQALPKEVDRESQGESRSTQKVKRKVVSTYIAKKDQVDKKFREVETSSTQSMTGQSTSLMARSLEIANLQAQIRLQQEELSRRPKTRRLTSASTAQYDDAIYLNNWRERIENIGNMNYPEEARRKQLYGTLRMMVAILPDGSIQNIEILKSSGYKVLDDAAIRIVRLAAPFQPFNVEMRKSTDVLEIIRTWKFEKTAQVY